VTGLPLYRQEKIAVADLFQRHAGIKDHIKGHLQNLVWHRWDKVAPIFRHALSVELPSTKDFKEPLLKRHDIVHRSGHDKSGLTVVVTADEIGELCSKIETFAQELDRRIDCRRTDADPGFDALSADGPPPG
jgi:HAMP domain-containing protein